MNFANAVAYASLSINTATRTAAGPMVGYLVDQFDPSVVDVVAFLDKRALQDGVDASDIFLGGRRLGLVVSVFGSTKGDFWDKAQALLAAFSPTLNYGADTAALGFRALTFFQPTADIVSWPTSAYPNGIPLQYFARPLAPPTYSMVRDEDGGTSARGLSKQFRLALLAKDPRKYAQTATEHTITTASTTATNLGDYPTFPTITIVTTTNTGVMSFSIAGTAFSATLDATSTTYTLNCAEGTFEKGSTLAMDLLTTGLVFPDLAPGGNVVSRGAVTGATATMSFRHAFA
jgi:hypothetical protein